MEIILKQLVDMEREELLKCIVGNETLRRSFREFLWESIFSGMIEERFSEFTKSVKTEYGPFIPSIIYVEDADLALEELEKTINVFSSSERVGKLTKRARGLYQRDRSAFCKAINEAVQTWFKEEVCDEIGYYEDMVEAIDAGDVSKLLEEFDQVPEYLDSMAEYGGIDMFYADEDGHYYKVEKIDK